MVNFSATPARLRSLSVRRPRLRFKWPKTQDLTLDFLDRAVVANGMIAEWAIHALADSEGRWIKRPHLHAILTHRFWRPGTRLGQPNAAWLGTPRHRQRLVDA